jgi:hypothetical protein
VQRRFETPRHIGLWRPIRDTLAQEHDQGVPNR